MELTRQGSEFEPRPIAPKPVLEGWLAALFEWQAMAEGAYSANTPRAQKADGASFQSICESRSEPYVPADPRPFVGASRVRLGLKKMGRETSARQDQAHPSGWKENEEFVDGARESLRVT